MTAKELIAFLATCEPDAEVYLGSSSAYTDISEVETPVPEMVF